MNYFLQDTLGIKPGSDYCFTNRLPKEIVSYRLEVGKEMKKYPDDPWKVTLKLGKDYPGLMLPSFIGNVHRLLIIHQDALIFFKEFDIGKYQAFPFTLIDHKDNVHSKEYLFLNPLGTRECLNYELSGVEFDEDGDIDGVKRYVLDKTKLKQIPDLFRLFEDDTRYIYSERFVNAIKEKGLTNFHFKKLVISP